MVVGQVQNVSSQYVALTRAVVRRACAACGRATGWKGTLTLKITANGKIFVVGGDTRVRQCLQRWLAQRLRLLTGRSGWLLNKHSPARITVTLR